MNTQIAYCGVNCFACSDYINKICPSCKHTPWIPETHNYGIHYFPISGAAISGVTPKSR